MSETAASRLLAATAPREERIVFEGIALIVREIPMAADVEAFRRDGDALAKYIVGSVFDEAGQQVFTADHLPALASRAKARFLPLIQAVIRVNGLDEDAEEKNSEASPAAKPS